MHWFWYFLAFCAVVLALGAVVYFRVKKQMRSPNSPLPVSTPATPRFAVDDPKGYEYLQQHGYAVFQSVANAEVPHTAKSLVRCPFFGK
jgi:hypothetical protein